MRMKFASLVVSLAILVFGGMNVTTRTGTASAQSANTLPTLTTQFTYTATVPASNKKLDLWVPIPSDSEWQTIRDLTVESPVSYKITREKRFGNRMVYLHLDSSSAQKKLDPAQLSVTAVPDLVVTVRFTVTRKTVQVLPPAAIKPSQMATGKAFGSNPVKNLLAPDTKVPTGGRYADMAREVVGDKSTDLDKMRAIFEYTVANMQYDYKKESPKYAQGDVAFVCDYKKGNCSDLHSYIISLARSQGIPAILEFGFPITGIPIPAPLPQEGTIAGYHCWIWFHTPQQGWMPLDASDARRWLDAGKPDVKETLFGNLVLQRAAVVFSRGRDITLVPAQKSSPLNYFIYPYAEEDGSPVTAKWTVKYKIVP